VKEGVIVDSNALIDRIGKLLKGLKEKSGIKFKSVSVNISGLDILTKHSHAVIPLAERGNKIISESDMQSVNEQARILGSSLEDEILHMIPLSYAIDAKGNIANPLGLYSHRLEVDLYLICARLSSVQSLTRVINHSGYEIKDIFFSGIATSRAVFTSQLNEGNSVLCDIGSDTTEIMIFKEGVVKDIEILNFGGDTFTRELVDKLKVPVDLAEDIKRSYGVIGNPLDIGEDKEILVKKSEFYKPIKQREVCEALTASANNICQRIKGAVEKKIPLHEINNFVIVGRSMLLEGFIENLEKALNLPVKLGRITNLQIVSLISENSELSGHKYLKYLTCLGMVSEALRVRPVGILPLHQPAKNFILKAFSKIKEAYQEYF
ncbi:MAG: cell division FtsA domain-containing protein, partial [Candidatus Omnitrophota bacterium]